MDSGVASLETIHAPDCKRNIQSARVCVCVRASRHWSECTAVCKPPEQKDRGSARFRDWLLSTVLKSILSFLAPNPVTPHISTPPTYLTKRSRNPTHTLHKATEKTWIQACRESQACSYHLLCMIYIPAWTSLSGCVWCANEAISFPSNLSVKIVWILKQYLSCFHQPADIVQGRSIWSIKSPPVEDSVWYYVLRGGIKKRD